jgi:uncharacterized membrane protein YoaK (UPF0700 family)
MSTTTRLRPRTELARIQTRDGLMVALTVVTGATDAIAFTRLGSVFTSVMTGNMVLFGMGIARGDIATLEHTGLALICFILGTILGARIAGRPRDGDSLWPRSFAAALATEFTLFLAVAICWWSTGSHPTGLPQSVLLGASALALGIQSSAVLRLNVSGLSTTYLTGTLTTLVQQLTTTRRLRGLERSFCLLLALVAGAALGAVLAINVPAAAPVVSLLILAGVVATAEVCSLSRATGHHEVA